MCPGPTPRTLTFLHRDGGFLLPQPQQDEEENQRDEDLESQDPLERAGGVRPPVQGWTGQDRPQPSSPCQTDRSPPCRASPAWPSPHMLPQGPQKVNSGPSFNGLFEGQESKCCLAQVRIRLPTPQPRPRSPRRGPAGTSQPACHPLWPMHMPRPSSRAGPRKMRPDWKRSDSPQSPTHKHLLLPQPLPHPRWLSVPRMVPATPGWAPG